MKKLIYFGIGLLVTYNIYVTYTLVKIKETFKEFHLLYTSAQKKSHIQSEYITKVNNIRDKEIHITNNKLNSGLVLSDKTEKKMNLIDIIDQKKLIFRFDDSYCNPCINKYLSRLKKIQTSIGSNDIILLVTSKNKKAIDQNFNIDGFNIFYINNLNYLEYDKNKSPYFFTLSKDLVIGSCHIPEESQLDLLEAFLKRQLYLLSMKFNRMIFNEHDQKFFNEENLYVI